MTWRAMFARPNLLDVRAGAERRAQAAPQLLAARRHILEEPRRLHAVHDGQRGGAHQRPARKGAAVVADSQGRYTRTLFTSTSHTFCEIRWVALVCH